MFCTGCFVVCVDSRGDVREEHDEQGYGTAYGYNRGKGTQTLMTNTYGANNGQLKSATYGNGDTVSWTYDALDRPRTKSYNGVEKHRWLYNAEGQLGTYTDREQGKSYRYLYDESGRCTRVDVSDGSFIRTRYNKENQVTSRRYQFGGQNKYEGYTYSTKDHWPQKSTFGDWEVTKGYDSLGRLTSETMETPEGVGTVKTAYSYLNWESDSTRTTGVLRRIAYTTASGGLSLPQYRYTYDYRGNIVEIRNGTSETSPLLERYEYTSMGQLRRHDSKTQNKTWEYWYDGCGNLTYKKEYAYTTAEQLGTAVRTIRYTYDGTWKDKLTSYDGKAITSDAIGNMKSYDGWSLSWQHGRELQSISKTGKTLSFKYNADGHRTEKTVNGVKTEYFLEGSRILGELKAGSGEVETRLQWYYYDSTGKRVGLVYRGVMYYYLYNQQGDVVGIVRAGTGQEVATYQYTAWGETTVTNLDGYTLGDANPFRYRGYCYDAETKLYYLNSRYYSRFINTDDHLNLNSGVLGLNTYKIWNISIRKNN